MATTVSELIPTGSRKFGTARPGSDYDFYAPEGLEVRQQLEAAGFKCVAQGFRPEPTLRALYKRDNVDVLLVRNARERAHIERLLAEYKLTHLLRNKIWAWRLWHFAEALADAVNEDNMTTTDSYAVRNVQVQDAVTFAQNGGSRRVARVTFYVGTHGPFNLEYPPGDATADKINADIAAKVAQLRQITGTAPTT